MKDAIRDLVLRSLGEAEWTAGRSGKVVKAIRCKFWPHGNRNRSYGRVEGCGGSCPPDVVACPWGRNRFIATSPNTERYDKGSRKIPIFPELLPFLEEAFEMADEGTTRVIFMFEGDNAKELGYDDVDLL